MGWVINDLDLLSDVEVIMDFHLQVIIHELFKIGLRYWTS